ncbi:MAG TPA: hypothetical protein VEH27_16745 [Methylomirabilota bacterium]|nr:hypothetical protein [Methylomirabilota bacterium]
MSNEQIENALRKAPTPQPPAGLEQRLVGQIQLPRAQRQQSGGRFSLFRWAPGFATVLVVGVFAAVAMQQAQLTELREQTASLRSAQPQPVDGADDVARLEQSLAALQKQSTELEALKKEMAEINALIPEVQTLATQNQRMRQELAALVAAAPEDSPEFRAAFAEANDKAKRIKCVNNLKNVGLAARIFATDNADSKFPQTFLSMTNELSTPMVLVCPADPSRESIKTWEQYQALGSSYDFLNPGGSETMPQVVLARCPIHNNVALSDGSVQQLNDRRRVVQKDGVWVISEELQ